MVAEKNEQPPSKVTLRKPPTRKQVLAAQILLERTKQGYGKDTPEIRAIAAATPREELGGSRKPPTRKQVLAAQILLERTKQGYGKDTPEIRAIAAATPREDLEEEGKVAG